MREDVVLSRLHRRDRRPHSGRTDWAGRLIVAAVRVYQAALSPLLGASCRFEPSCSAYCVDAVRKHGGARGLALGIRRILRCHPFHAGGYDPVP